MGSFWDIMDEVGRTLDDVDEVLDNVTETNSTVRHGYNKVRSSAEYYNNIPNNIEINLRRIERAEIKKKKCINRSTILCILMIAITVLVCIFL